MADGSLDIIVLIFVLSAIHPEKLEAILSHLLLVLICFVYNGFWNI